MKIRAASRALSILALSFLVLGCGEDPTPASTTTPVPSTPASLVPASGPAITASPNPVPAGPGLSGTTTVAWNTGGGAGEVYLSTNGSEEKLFAKGSQGSQDAPWIAAETNYDFRLYSAADHTKPLASVTVTRNR